MLVTIRGEAAHAGATPMNARRDALAGAVEAAVELERLGRGSLSGTTVATVGAISAFPGAINVIPGEAELMVDIRDRDLIARDAVAEAFIGALEAITERRGLDWTSRRSPAIAGAHADGRRGRLMPPAAS